MMAPNTTLQPVNLNYQQNHTPQEFILIPKNHSQHSHGRCFPIHRQACVCCQHGQYMHQTPQVITENPQQPAFINENRKVQISRYMENNANSSLNLKGIKFILKLKCF